MPAFPYNKEGTDPRGRGEAAGPASLSHPDAAQLRAVRRAATPASTCATACGFACPINAKAGTHNTVIPMALATGNCELRTGCVAAEVVVDDRGRARGVRYFDAEAEPSSRRPTWSWSPARRDRNRPAPAQLEVQALSQRRRQQPRLGRPQPPGPRLLRRLRAVRGRDLTTKPGPGRPSPSAISTTATPDWSAAACCATSSSALPYLFSNMRPPGAAALGQGAQGLPAPLLQTQRLRILGPVQEMPNFAARVSVDPAVKDDWGIPVCRLSGARHPHDIEIGRVPGGARPRPWLKEAGAVATGATARASA